MDDAISSGVAPPTCVGVPLAPQGASLAPAAVPRAPRGPTVRVAGRQPIYRWRGAHPL